LDQLLIKRLSDNLPYAVGLLAYVCEKLFHGVTRYLSLCQVKLSGSDVSVSQQMLCVDYAVLHAVSRAERLAEPVQGDTLLDACPFRSLAHAR
jgi:hypothetical protein